MATLCTKDTLTDLLLRVSIRLCPTHEATPADLDAIPNPLDIVKAALTSFSSLVLFRWHTNLLRPTLPFRARRDRILTREHRIEDWLVEVFEGVMPGQVGPRFPSSVCSESIIKDQSEARKLCVDEIICSLKA